MIQRSHKLLERYLYSRIIYNMLSEQAWMEYLNSDDPAILETIKVFREGKAFPQAPEKKEEKPQNKAA
jgi:carboxyl-terminal processing protease